MILFLALFCLFGACMSGLAAVTLAWPGTPLDRVWELNPTGHAELVAAGPLAAMGMAILSPVMVVIAIGLLARRRWAYWAAVVGLVVNATGDAVAAVVRGDARTLIGVPIAGFFVYWLLRPSVRARFPR